MRGEEIGVRSLESSDKVHVWLRPNSPSGTVDDMDNPRQWRVVSNMWWEDDENDSYYHEEEGRRIHTTSTTYQITFEPLLPDGDGPNYTMKYTTHRDGYTEYSPVKSENQNCRTSNIGRIERVDKQ